MQRETVPRLATVAAAPLLLACVSHSLSAPEIDPVSEQHQYAEVKIDREIDVLFLIDNSGSMAEEQGNLARNFPAFMRELEAIEGGLPSVRIGVVTSDLGAGGLDVATCRGVGDGGNFQVTRVQPPPSGGGVSQRTESGCGLQAGARWIAVGAGGAATNLEPGRSLADVFSCLAERGVGFCGYEHQLQAVRLALMPQPGVNPGNAGFLRPGAYLAIVLITDEDDCSAPPDAAVFFREPLPGQSASYRCATEGHLCDGRPPPAAGPFAAPLASCRSNERGRLVSVRQIVDDLRGLKPGRPDRVLVAAIAGWPPPGAAQIATYRTGPGEGRAGELDLLPVCASANGKATPAVRINELVSAFGERGSIHSICQDDFGPVMRAIGKRLASLPLTTCLASPPADSDSARPGLQPQCVLYQRSGSADRATETLVPACDAGPAVGRPCWRLVADATCAGSGLRYEVDRGSVGPPAGDHQMVLKCLTAAR